MTALYTIIAAIIVKYLVDSVKVITGFIYKKLPDLPAWVVKLLPLWKLLTAIAATFLVVWGTKQFAVELEHPLVILVVAQIAHELTSALRKPSEEG